MPDYREIVKRLIAGPESGGMHKDSRGTIIKNKMGSSAKGKYQFIDDTWNSISRQYEEKTGRKLQMDSLQDNEIAMNILIDNNANALKKNGIPINPTTLYAMHFKGDARWVKAAMKNPNVPAKAFFKGDEITQNPVYIPNGNIPIGKVLGNVNNAIKSSAKKQNISLPNFNPQITSKMKELDPELVKKFKLGGIPQYSNKSHKKETLRQFYDAFSTGRDWIKKNKPEEEKAFVNYWKDKGYLGRDSEGNPAGPFNEITVKELREEEKKKNNGTSPERNKVRELFGMANDLGKIFDRSWYNANKTKYSTKEDGQYFNKENVLISRNLSPAQKKVADEIMKSYSKNGQRKSHDTFVNEKGESVYNAREFLTAMQDNLNKNLDEGDKVQLIDKNGKRGKNLAIDLDNLSKIPTMLGKDKNINAGTVFIGDSSGAKQLVPNENKIPESNIDFIDEGFADDGYSYDSWDGGGSGEASASTSSGSDINLPSVSAAPTFTYPRFQHVTNLLANDPEYQKILKNDKLSEAEKRKQEEEYYQKAAKKYDDDSQKKELNDFLTEFQTLADNLPENANKGYDPKNMKGGKFPMLETASALFGILSGNNMAKTELPERNEEVSDLFRNYTAEVKKLSEIGLKPEEEAYAKNMLAESYQSSLDMIQRASNGNRNLVLGNLGRLDYQKQKGLLDLAVADSRAKTEALFKYGEAVKYISDFDANRDIANNERKYQNAMMTKQAGGQLAAQGWANLMNNIQYYKENKPGSANHMLRTHYMRKFFDVDPNVTDPNNYYHPSQLAKRNAELERMKQTATASSNLLASLPEEHQKEFMQYARKTGNDFGSQDYLDLLNFRKNNPNGKMNLSKIGEARGQGNYAAMFAEIDSNNTSSKNVTPAMIENAKTQQAVSNINQTPLYLQSTPEVDPNQGTVSTPTFGKQGENFFERIAPTPKIPTTDLSNINLSVGKKPGSALFQHLEEQAKENEKIRNNANSFLGSQRQRIEDILFDEKQKNPNYEFLNTPL